MQPLRISSTSVWTIHCLSGKWNNWGFWIFSTMCITARIWQILSPPESTCTDQLAVTPTPNQDHVPPIPPTLKLRLRRKRAARNAVSITVSAESTAVTAEVGKSTPLFPELVENATVTPESVGSVPVIPKPANPDAVKSAPVLLELVESTVVIPESVKSFQSLSSLLQFF